MSKFKVGEKVKVRLVASLPTSGLIGIVEEEPEKVASLYKVQIKSHGFALHYFFFENDLEPADG